MTESTHPKALTFEFAQSEERPATTVAEACEEHEAEATAQALRDRGYAVLEGTHEPAVIARFRAAITAIHRAHGAPLPYAPAARNLTPEVMINPTGFIVTQLLATCPELADDLLPPRVVAAVRRLLGDDATLELTGANLCDHRRPFFSWHNHIGGIDVEEHRARGVFPRFRRSQRVIVVVYTDAIDGDGGELRALPRAIDAATEPPYDRFTTTWPGQVCLHFPAGSTVIFEQCTWHAVMPRRRPGPRIFLGAYLRAADAPPTTARDHSLDRFTGGGPLLRSLLPRRAP